MADSEIEGALKIFGKLVGLLGEDGSINWAWFGNPEAQILGSTTDANIGLPANRQCLGQLVRTLTGGVSTDADEVFTTGYSWVPLNTGEIQIGFAWTDPGKALEIGFGSKASIPAGTDPLDLAVLAKLLKIDQGQLTSELGDVVFEGAFPAPAFLKSLKLTGQTNLPGVEFDVTDKSGSTRALTFPLQDASIFGWDCARLTLFVIEAWVHDNAAKSIALTQIDQHLFPMFGEPQQPQIGAFPLFGSGNMGKPPDFTAWQNSALDTADSSGAGALAFLWHLRALLTANTAGTFASGAGFAFMPLVADAPGGSMPTNIGAAAGTYDPQSAPAGAYIGITSTGGISTLCIDIVNGQHPNLAANYVRIPLAALAAGNPPTLTRPSLPSPLPTLGTLPAASGLTLSMIEGLQAISFDAALSGTGVPFLEGTYTFTAVLSSPVHFEVTAPKLPITLAFPPGSVPASTTTPASLVASLANWVISAIPTGGSDSSAKLVAIAQELAQFLEAELQVPGSGKIAPLLGSIAKTLAAGQSIDIPIPPFDLKVSLAEGNTATDKFFHVVTTATYGPIDIDEISDFPISIGQLKGSLDLAVDKPGNPLWGFQLGFTDLRIGDGSGGASGLIASLIPNMKQAPGFSFNFGWTNGTVKITGGGKIPIQLTLGPLSISQLSVEAVNSSLTIGINLTFQLAVITISTYDLGLKFDYKTKLPTPALSGLGLSFDAGGISLSGMFLNNNGDYIGTASVSIEDLFSLSAIGGYTQIGADKMASLFIFASLVAPLGGPPFFFLTGIAGGFGYNRILPPLTLMSKHPFIKIMSGTPLSNDPSTALTALDAPGTGFAPKVGDFWIAAGIQFVSFGFINGKVIVAVAFGHDFSFNLLGIASFGINPVAYFEIDILVTVDQQKFLLVAGVSPNSYLIHPDIFNLAGDFGLGVWHSGDHSGDFLVSIGGFHPYFKTPSYYPKLNRVSVKANVFGFVHLSIECFFACTPQALMAGASVSLSATFAGIGAGLDVYVDVLIEWDPFFILATMGVTLWFEFIGRHEIGVDLQIHTPPFGGVATVHLFIISFDVSFGSDIKAPPPPPLFNFIAKRLNVPATAWNTTGASLNLYNTDKAAGLVRVLFTSGRTTSPTGDGTKAQEGSDPKNPVKVAPEFSFVVRTHLPFLESSADLLIDHPTSPLSGTVNLPLCGESDLSTQLAMTLFNVTENKAIVVPTSDINRTGDLFPYANFGASALPAAQADSGSARQAISSIDTSHPAVPLTDGFSFDFVAQPQPVTQNPMSGPEEQFSLPAETYPLPLGWPVGTPQVTVSAKSRLQFAANAKANALAARIAPQAPVDRRKLALQRMKVASTAPWQIGLMTAQFDRAVLTAPRPVTTVAAVPTGAVAMAPPASPTRRAELAAVALRILPAHIAQAPPRPALKLASTLQLARPVHSILAAPALAAILAPIAGIVVKPAPPATPPPVASVSVVSGHAAHLDISGNVRAPQGALSFTGTQTVRAVFLTGFGDPISDQYFVGNQRVALPARTRRVLLIGEGMLTGAPASLGSVGVEPASSIFAISRTEFAGHGCVIRSNTPLLTKFNPGDTLTGNAILSVGSSFSILLPAAPRAASVIITVKATVPAPAAAASEVRWRAVNATLSGLTTLATPDGAAFVMDVAAAAAWKLYVEVDSDWKITGAVVANMSSADALSTLRTHATWSFVDDRFLAPASPLSTSVTLELANG